MSLGMPTGELTAEQRAAISNSLAESRLERLAAQLWSDAIDAGEYTKAKRIAGETATWFEPEAEL